MPIDPKIVKEFQQAMIAIQRDLEFSTYWQVIEDKILSYVSKHPTARTFEINRAIEEAAQPEYKKFFSDIFRKYNDTLETVNDFYSTLGVDVQRDFKRIQAIERVNQIKLGKYEDATVKEIQQVTRKGFIKKYTQKEFGEALKNIGGKVTSYGDTIATTQIKAYARVAKNEKANLAEVFYYEYVGVIRKTTRPFCKSMLGQTLHIDAINKINESVVGPAFINPCITYCGGWNCYHDWEPDPFFE